MEVTSTMDLSAWARKHLDEADADLVRTMLQTFAEALMAAEAQAHCGADYGEVSPERVNSRNGFRTRRWDTRAGTIDWPSRSFARAATSLQVLVGTSEEVNLAELADVS